ncbi:MAG: DNA topoisomerase II [Amphiamblys sp. WSBS2006]|nr:MAG: DNA topoisomerase II [Amphiamblys sp. WSBS2006]
MSQNTKKNKTVEEMYQKKTQVEHILLRPDTYIGSTEKTPQAMWVLEDGRFVQKTISFVPGLFKIFDEILVNAADNKMRDRKMTTIRVDVGKDGWVSVFNDGEGIPIQIHKEERVYIPELIFGHLLTSSNYNDEEKKMTGGRNGYGAKLCNIFSSEFVVETVDKQKKKKFRQVYTKNMSEKSEPEIGPSSEKNYTKISFSPDFSKFGLEGIDSDHFLLFQKRAHDIAGCLPDVDVFFNGTRIEIGSFKEYVGLYFPAETDMETSTAYTKDGKRWEVCCAASEGQFQQVSFVNNINTYKGGTHISHVADKVIGEITTAIQKRKRTAVKAFQVKPHLFLFINCLIENPSFDSQTKENMSLKAGSFGSSFSVSDAFSKRLCTLPIIDNTLSWARFKQEQQLKKTDGQKRIRLTGIPKLDDANNAGTKDARDCTLILTEGDSAKALAIAGLAVVGRANYGVFPLRGKLLNVREAMPKQLMENAEVNSIKKILGLQQKKEYQTADSLRYGHVMIMTDQDHDGSHIKGLLINMLDYFWPSLLKLPGFLLEFVTPIVRCTRRKEEAVFYTIPEYEAWKEETRGETGWKVKYYKGLGTSTSEDAKKYFKEMGKNRKTFRAIREEERLLVDMAFNRKKADERKEWLRGLTKDVFLDHRDTQITYGDFINKELILFSHADNVRSIPSAVDGLKPGQRKILYSCFKRNLQAEIKVAQFVGYVAEHSAYHHGEHSLASTIVGMAQNFVGSNNVNLLSPNGQFGTRQAGGTDSASPRYIFTALENIARSIFPEVDNAVLDYLDEDGDQIEPEYYVPVVPFLLFNGARGIGTGWRTEVPAYHPIEIVDVVLALLDGGQAPDELVPWYAGFTGEIKAVGNKRYTTKGVYKTGKGFTKKKIVITDLPIGVWIQTYKEFLEKLIVGEGKKGPQVRSYAEEHTDKEVCFIVQTVSEEFEGASLEDIENTFRLSSTINTANLVLFDARGRIKRYENTGEIIRQFYGVRLELYQKRKAHLTKILSDQAAILENKARFVLGVVRGDIVIQKKKKKEVEDVLHQEGYLPDTKKEGGSFDYLLSMPLMTLTEEKVEKLLKEEEEKKNELKSILSKSEKDLWREDLTRLRRELLEFGIPEPGHRGEAESPERVSSHHEEASEPGLPSPRKTEKTEKPKKTVSMVGKLKSIFTSKPKKKKPKASSDEDSDVYEP